MSFSKNTWNQIKGITVEQLIKAVEKDGWVPQRGGSASRPYRNQKGQYITIHYHPKKTYGPKLLKALINDIGWTEADMKRLGLIK